jgi:hypothetical protein
MTSAWRKLIIVVRDMTAAEGNRNLECSLLGATCKAPAVGGKALAG